MILLSEKIKKFLLVTKSSGIDNTFIICVTTLSLIGFIMVTSTTLDLRENNAFYFIIKHSIFLAMGITIAFLLAHIKLDFYYKYSQVILLFALILSLLVFIPGLGIEVKGAKRWINLGLFTVQVSEISRLLILIWVSSYIVRKPDDNTFNKPLAAIVLLALIILLQKDFGSAFLLVASFLGLSLVAGISIKKFAGWTLAVVIAIIPIIYFQPYRFKRILSFLDPWADPSGGGFQVIASSLAFSKGGLFGLGLGSSIQKLHYLPESYNDFVFAVIAEELGLFFTIFVMATFILLISRIFKLAKKSTNNDLIFASYLTYSIGFLISIQTLIHMLVNTGLFPTKGMGLPFISYGGTNILVMFICIGILIRIQIENRRKISQAYQKEF